MKKTTFFEKLKNSLGAILKFRSQQTPAAMLLFVFVVGFSNGSIAQILGDNTEAIDAVNKETNQEVAAHSSLYIDAMSTEKQYNAMRDKENIVQFFSHGKPGALYLEGTWLQKEPIAQFNNSKFSPFTFQVSVCTAVFSHKSNRSQEAITNQKKELMVLGKKIGCKNNCNQISTQ
jgi:hypothetical protein